MTYWGVKSWNDLTIFSSDDLADAITEDSNVGELETPICHKFLGFIINYAQSGKSLFPVITMNYIVKLVSTTLVHQDDGAPTPPLLLLDIQLKEKLFQLWTISLERMKTIFLVVRSP